jgi:hypothetical protein
MPLTTRGRSTRRLSNRRTRPNTELRGRLRAPSLVTGLAAVGGAATAGLVGTAKSATAVNPARFMCRTVLSAPNSVPRMSRIAALAAAAFALAAAPAAAAADDYAATARNIIPSGQYGSVPPPAGADAQALMYDALTPLFDQVTAADLLTKFKSERFGLDEDGPGTPEAVPRAGVTVVRDRFNVPHITGASRDDVTWAMGYLLAEDRGLLLTQARNAARLAAIDAPNINAFGLVVNLKQYTPTKQVDAMILKNGLAALRSAGAPGKAVLHDIDAYLQGMNARLGGGQKWSRVDIFSANALIGQIFGQGGGDEARRSDFLSSLRKRYGKTKGTRMFDDLSEFDDPDAQS